MEQNKWIDVKKELPEIEDIVLAYAPEYCSDGVIVLTWDGSWYDYNGQELTEYVTHWMPMPPPPTDLTDQKG